MTKAEGTRDAAEVAVELSTALTRLRSRLREESGVTTSGFTLSQLAIVKRIITEGPTTAASLAATEHVSQQAIAQSVTILKAGGLVRGERDANDGRRVLISVTAKGRELYDAMSASRKAWLAQAIEAVVEPGERPDLDTAIELLERLAGANFEFETETR
ncbi:MAG TPA: MarR family transcriptional regulator [Kribbella sp.]|uniref:MarR family winged helix-turn-helix transcriptional regulator n=1 Tax=Kribbella sp. TaxID=1871183 RepID=UPI002D79285B|nr:MarR family transcriptional regulator [Kribbella sp.]HET6292843.1 MarR family transcriptional regulator [Kribbella sp.]